MSLASEMSFVSGHISVQWKQERRRTFIETKYFRRESLAKGYKNRSRDQYTSFCICKYFCDISVYILELHYNKYTNNISRSTKHINIVFTRQV